MMDYYKAQEIILGLWLGPQEAAKSFKGEIISVSEIRSPEEPKRAYYVRIMKLLKGPPWIRADLKALEKVCNLIDSSLAANVLVHCGAGMERSPLAVAYYLVTRKKMSLDAAYDLIEKKRPIIIRKEWLPPRWVKHVENRP